MPPPADTQNGIIRSYRVSVSVTETRQSFFLFLEGTELQFNSAHPFYTYTFTVAAETVNGAGPFGVDVTLTAPEDGKSKSYYTFNMYIFIQFPLNLQCLQGLHNHLRP